MFRLSCAVLAFAGSSLAVDWHFLSWYTPSGEEFIQFSGELVIPSLPMAGTNYVWPGLQPTDNSGVYQNVLQASTTQGTDPWIGSGWCCSNPSLPWGSGFQASPGSTVIFDNVKTDSSNWTSTLNLQGDSSKSTSNTFTLGDKTFDDAVIAIEQYDSTWTFGPVYWNNLLIISTGTDSSWCTNNPSNYNSATQYTITGLSSSVSGNTVQCKIDQVEFTGPNGAA